MPWGDGTGPWGLGPMTGRAAGYCAGYNVPGYANPVEPAQTFEYPKDAEIAELKAEREALQRELKAIEDRLRELEKK